MILNERLFSNTLNLLLNLVYPFDSWGVWGICHLFFNQIRAKVGVNGRHVNFAVVSGWINRNDVTSNQVENPSCVRGTVDTFIWDRDLNHCSHTAVHSHLDPSSAVIVDLQVNIVPSSGRHSQFSIVVLHPSSKMAVRGIGIPVFNHYRVKRKKDVNSGWLNFL